MNIVNFDMLILQTTSIVLFINNQVKKQLAGSGVQNAITLTTYFGKKNYIS